MKNKGVLLVEDNPDDVKPTLRALEKSSITDEAVVVSGGDHSGRDTSVMPQVILLDLNMPRLGGIEVLQHLRADERTKLLPVVVLTTSRGGAASTRSSSK